jgi:hypothetical protein
MKARTRILLGIAVPTAVITCFAAATRVAVAQDLYRVVTTRPVISHGWKVDEEYHDDERLTRAFNQLVSEGFDPVFVQTMVSGAQLPQETRLVIVGRRK